MTFTLTLPVMLAVAIASTVSRSLSYGTIYTTKLPGIAGRAVQDRLTRWCHPELRGVGLAHDDQSRTPQPEDELGVEARDVAARP